jgi:hypothetical protein
MEPCDESVSLVGSSSGKGDDSRHPLHPMPEEPLVRAYLSGAASKEAELARRQGHVPLIFGGDSWARIYGVSAQQ